MILNGLHYMDFGQKKENMINLIDLILLLTVGLELMEL
jgi:hypothetical protein